MGQPEPNKKKMNTRSCFGPMVLRKWQSKFSILKKQNIKNNKIEQQIKKMNERTHATHHVILADQNEFGTSNSILSNQCFKNHTIYLYALDIGLTMHS